MKLFGREDYCMFLISALAAAACVYEGDYKSAEGAMLLFLFAFSCKLLWCYLLWVFGFGGPDDFRRGRPAPPEPPSVPAEERELQEAGRR